MSMKKFVSKGVEMRAVGRMNAQILIEAVRHSVVTKGGSRGCTN